jgi:8-amino-7-oxononanoate synthase
MPTSASFWDELACQLQSRETAGLRRDRPTWTHLSPRLVVDGLGNELLNFGSNDYLCLSWYPGLLQPDGPRSEDHGPSSETEEDPGASMPEQRKEGAGASPLVTGSTPEHDALIRELARFECEEDAILFSSGFAANVGVVSSLAREDDILFSDRLNHASLIDGCRLSRAKTIVYPHNDIEELRALIAKHRHEGRRGFVVTDSLFSMDGDTPDLVAMKRVLEEWDLIGIIDEAHATGVYGKRGTGLVEHQDAKSERWIRTGTLSKAVGSVGGFVAGPQVLIDWLTNFARSYIYSTAAPASLLRRTRGLIGKLESMESEREKLRANATHLRSSLRTVGLRVGGVDSPIVAIYANSIEEVLAWSQRLRKCGLFVPAIRPPTVPVDSCMLRVSLNTSHTKEDLNFLTEVLAAT